MAEGRKTAAGVVMGGGVAVAVVAAVAALWSLGQGAPEPVPSPASPAATPAPPAAVDPVPAAVAPSPAPATPAQEPSPAPAAAPEGAPETAPQTARETADPVSSADAEAEPAAVARFDTLRVTPAGALTLAGDVAPGARVELLLEGVVIDTVTANAQGDFAAVTSAAPSAEPRTLQLRVTGADGVARLSEESLTVAPSPLAVAQAATAKGAAPDTVAAAVEAAQALAETPLLTGADGTARLLAGVSETLVIDTLALSDDGTVTISGRGAPKGALLRAYVDNAEVGLVQGAADGRFAMRLPAAAPGPHVLRVDALDAAGKVLARAEQRFEGLAPPPEPALAAPAAPAAEGAAARSRMVTVAPGGTLWAIASARYGDPLLYVQIFEANRGQIRDPDLIYPGQVFTLPE
ncbi:LysM peptidoglycan-binding domain-containing protein [Rhodobacter capsulatus]|uniref:LysM peptidoglycan-binding domain-containing protein n=1 Tax=Rhodobacter capsulatus TaxID=1061 RepID=UPI004027EE70